MDTARIKQWLDRYGTAAGLVVLAFLLGLTLAGGRDADPGHADHAAAAAVPAAAAPTRWTCSMHPQIILPTNDQKCPICFMDLIPLEEDAQAGLGPRDLKLTASAAALAEILTEPVRRQEVTRQVRLAGKVGIDETRTGTITARFPGRMERLRVQATGQTVARGEILGEVYSPELLATRTELRSALAAAAGPADATVQAVRERLRRWGLDPAQVERDLGDEAAGELQPITAPAAGVVIERRVSEGDYLKTGEVMYRVADLERVWVVLDAFERDVAWLTPGQGVRFTTRALPGSEFAGEILFVDPVLDERTRTVEVRVAAANPDGRLRPGMLVSGLAEVRPAKRSLVVPATAPLLTGTRAVVYVRSGGADDQPVFSGREVELGPRMDQGYIVNAGLQEGDQVVVQGGFKLDSALQIQARPSMMTPEAGGFPGEGAADAARPAVAQEGPAAAEPAVPDCVRRTLADALDAYSDLQAALAGDDEPAARAAAAVLAERLARIDCDTADLPAAAAAIWTPGVTRLREAAARTAGAADLAARRLALSPLSDDLWDLLAAFPATAAAPIRRFHCPMARDGAGADWIQRDATTANPYYGAAMLRCGSQTATLGAADGEGSR